MSLFAQKHDNCPTCRCTDPLPDIAAAREAELRAEVERLKDANREAAMKSLADLGQAQEALDRAIDAEAEAARLRALLDEAREVLKQALNYIENTESELGIKLGCGDIARATLAKIGDTNE